MAIFSMALLCGPHVNIFPYFKRLEDALKPHCLLNSAKDILVEMYNFRISALQFFSTLKMGQNSRIFSFFFLLILFGFQKY